MENEVPPDFGPKQIKSNQVGDRNPSSSSESSTDTNDGHGSSGSQCNKPDSINMSSQSPSEDETGPVTLTRKVNIIDWGN